MRLFPVLAWAFMLVILTCNFSLESLYHQRSIHIFLNRHPSYAEFLALDYQVVHSQWFLVKTGHLIGFAVLYALVLRWNGNWRRSAWIVVSFAVLTEILQLYCYRDGRLYDVAIDSAGVMVCSYLLRKRVKEHR